MARETLLTREGYERKKAELEAKERRLYQEIPALLAQAKEHSGGDFRENKEYLYLVEEQELLEREVRALRELLANARIISEEEIRTDEVGIGSRVILKDIETGEEWTVTLVPPAEVDLLEGRIGIDSPVGRALLTHGKGKQVVVPAPAGKIRYEILGIERG
ncbi:MAG: GreA/GreB family elongation factor [Candidatus Bipolaricaulaceae bacterium]